MHNRFPGYAFILSSYYSPFTRRLGGEAVPNLTINYMRVTSLTPFTVFIFLISAFS